MSLKNISVPYFNKSVFKDITYKRMLFVLHGGSFTTIGKIS